MSSNAFIACLVLVACVVPGLSLVAGCSGDDGAGVGATPVGTNPSQVDSGGATRAPESAEPSPSTDAGADVGAEAAPLGGERCVRAAGAGTAGLDAPCSADAECAEGLVCTTTDPGDTTGWCSNGAAMKPCYRVGGDRNASETFCCTPKATCYVGVCL